MKRILIVEDDPVVANIYKNKLLNSGFDVSLAGDGDDALRQLGQRSPDALLLDLGLPKVNGVDVIKRVRADSKVATIPIVVLSNAYVTDLVQAAWKAGANRCLTKSSCSPGQLVEIIQSVLSTPQRSEMPAPSQQAAHSPEGPTAMSELAEPARSDASFQAQIRQSFLTSGPVLVTDLRRRFQSFAQRGAETRPISEVIEFYRAVHSLSGNAGIAGFTKIATLSAALEALLKELYEKPKNIGPSPIRTIAHAIDVLSDLFAAGAVTTSDEAPSPLALVVDDETVSRRTIALALEKARLRTITLDDPTIALKCLEDNAIDLIFSDVNMPQLNGFDFCAKVRELKRHKTTPVVFVTTHNDFENRVTSKLSGATDLIGKPFLLVELAVKALTVLNQKR